MAKLSVVISAFNEEKKIKVCLESVKWADEIIFIDNNSTDQTRAIAQKYTKKIYTQKNNPANIDLQKNTGISKATGDWILVLDGDEAVTPELAQEIQSICHSEIKLDANGYWIPRKNIIFGKWIEHSGWYPDYQLRLFRRGHGKYEKQHYHEPLTVLGKTAYLHMDLLHANYENVGQFLYKHLQVYAQNEADELLRKNYIFDPADAIRFPLREFLSRYFARDGYKDGFHGLVLSLLMAIYHFAIFVYLWEKEKFTDTNTSTLEFLNKELQKNHKEMTFWLKKKKIEEEKNIVKKLQLQIKNKLHL